MKATDSRNLHGHVIRELGKRIVVGDLRPGDVLPREENLAESMDVSRTALREALKVLSAKGLIESRPRVGTRVRATHFWNQLDADVLSWRCASTRASSLRRSRRIMWHLAPRPPTASSRAAKPRRPFGIGRTSTKCAH